MSIWKKVPSPSHEYGGGFHPCSSTGKPAGYVKKEEDKSMGTKVLGDPETEKRSATRTQEPLLALLRRLRSVPMGSVSRSSILRKLKEERGVEGKRLTAGCLGQNQKQLNRQGCVPWGGFWPTTARESVRDNEEWERAEKEKKSDTAENRILENSDQSNLLLALRI